MVNNKLGKLRRSTVVMTFAPGSVVDFREEHGAPVSGVIAGLDEWDRSFRPPGLTDPQKISEPRLERKLNIRGFRLPPVVDEDYRDANGQPDNRSLLAARFPDWLQCPTCDRIAPSSKWGQEPGRAYRFCQPCTNAAPGRKKVFAVPVRFVMACEAGHLSDFPWHYWVEHKDGCTNTKGFLLLKLVRPGLAGLFVRCPVCNESKSMDGIFSADKWRGFRCDGRRPWLAGENQICEKQPRVVQRGASNLFFPVIESALSIPPWSDRLQEALGVYWNSIITTAEEDRETYIRILARNDLKPALQDLKMTPEELVRRINERINKFSQDQNPDIRVEEYRQFVSGFDTRPEDDLEFEIRKVSVPDDLKAYFNNIVRVVRLREVRALKGFTRINPPEDDKDTRIAKLFNKDPGWLPAIEVRGEGIFLSFLPAALQTWEVREEIKKRAESVNALFQADYRKRYGGAAPARTISARFLLVHTFAHAMMRQLTLECGYSSAALRERLYVSDGEDGMAGLLIYTSTSDSDGTLGGLQRQGTTGRIAPTIRSAIKDMEWCSSDPLCINGTVSSAENYSLAACHACCLSPETACEEFNHFLDRATLTGLPDSPESGFFTPLIRER